MAALSLTTAVKLGRSALRFHGGVGKVMFPRRPDHDRSHDRARARRRADDEAGPRGHEECRDYSGAAAPSPVRSKLAAEPALRTHVLATVASGFAHTREELLEFLDNTLYATQTDDAGRL
ncbi:MAG: hypothetical protein ACOC05_10545, partial [Oceanicaulis sp.]